MTDCPLEMKGTQDIIIDLKEKRLTKTDFVHSYDINITTKSDVDQNLGVSFKS